MGSVDFNISKHRSAKQISCCIWRS